MKIVFLMFAALALSGCVTTKEIKANMIVVKNPDQLKKCDYIGTFKMNFASDGVSKTLASKSEQRKSAVDFSKVVAAGANTIYRIETAPAPLVTVNAYRCSIKELMATPQ